MGFLDEDSFKAHSLQCQLQVSASFESQDKKVRNGETIEMKQPNQIGTSLNDLHQNREDFANNNESKFGNDSPMDKINLNENSDDEHSSSTSEQSNKIGLDQIMFPQVNNNSELSLNEQLLNSSMTLEAINNTRITLARLATAAASAETAGKPVQDLSILQVVLEVLKPRL